MKNRLRFLNSFIVVTTMLLNMPLANALEVTTLTTAGDRSVLLDEQLVDKNLIENVSANTTLINIDPETTFQTVDGLGYALTQASAAKILALPVSMQDQLLNELFHPITGKHVSMLRIAIGASDLSTELYTYSDQVRSGEHFVPDPSKTYYIDSPSHDVRLGATGVDEQPYTAPNSPSGADFEWKFVPAEDGLFFIDRAAGGPVPRLRTDDTNLADMQETSSDGWWEKWELTPGEGHGAYFLSLPLKGFGNHDRLQIDDSQRVRMVDNDQSAGTWESFTFTEVGSSTAFTLDGVETATTIPVLKKILAINPNIKIMATPWTAPLWMKTNNDWVGGSLKPEYYSDLAQYFVEYLSAMRQEGIDIWGLTVQNEPENPWNEPSMLMNAEEQFALVDGHVGPALQTAGFGDVKILSFDHNLDHPEYPIKLAQSQYVDGSAFHLYAGEIETMSTVYETTGKDVYLTEMWTGRPEIDTPEEWAKAFDLDFWVHMEWIVMGSLRNHSRAVLEWNLITSPPTTATGCTLCLGSITLEGLDVQRNVSHYIISQLSSFVEPGAKRIESSEFSGDIINVALQNPDGSLVVLVYNKHTEAAQTVTLSADGQAFEHDIAPRTAVTFKWQSAIIPPDEDGDGVDDSKDQCPGTNHGVMVDEFGCPIIGDDDQDGIANAEDLCPQTPLSEPVDGDGCSLLDNDDDGVRNPFDRCPNTPVGVAVDGQGCANPTSDLSCTAEVVQDWDNGGQISVIVKNNSAVDINTWTVFLSLNDGVSVTNSWNVILKETSPLEATPGDWNAHIGIGESVDFGFRVNATADIGSVSCSTQSQPVDDEDNDGVIDAVDQCPGTPEGAIVDSMGCEFNNCLVDSDGDGVMDCNDLCPNTPTGTIVNSSGCEEGNGSCTGVTVYPDWLHADFEGGPNTHMLEGDLMVFEGGLFQANWYTSSIPGSDDSWTTVGSCSEP